MFSGGQSHRFVRPLQVTASGDLWQQPAGASWAARRATRGVDDLVERPLAYLWAFTIHPSR